MVRNIENKDMIEYVSGWDEDVYRSLKGLVNKNNGVWTSKKQRNFLYDTKIKSSKFNWISPSQAMKENVQAQGSDGVAIINMVLVINRYISHNVRWAFVLDHNGVKSLWKLANKSKPTKQEWERPENINTAHLELAEQEREEKFRHELGMFDGEHLGTVGEKYNFGTVTLVATKTYQGDSFSYYDSGIRTWNCYKDANGNIIYHNGAPSKLEVGETAILTAKVKKHTENEKRMYNVTNITHPKFTNIEIKKED